MDQPNNLGTNKHKKNPHENTGLDAFLIGMPNINKRNTTNHFDFMYLTMTLQNDRMALIKALL